MWHGRGPASSGAAARGCCPCKGRRWARRLPLQAHGCAFQPSTRLFPFFFLASLKRRRSSTAAVQLRAVCGSCFAGTEPSWELKRGKCHPNSTVPTHRPNNCHHTIQKPHIVRTLCCRCAACLYGCSPAGARICAVRGGPNGAQHKALMCPQSLPFSDTQFLPLLRIGPVLRTWARAAQSSMRHVHRFEY